MVEMLLWHGCLCFGYFASVFLRIVDCNALRKGLNFSEALLCVILFSFLIPFCTIFLPSFLFVAGFLMRALAPPMKITRKKKKQKTKGQAQGGALPAVEEENSEATGAAAAGSVTRFGPATAAEVRLVKKYAINGGADGDGHWSDTDEDEEEEAAGGEGSRDGGGGSGGLEGETKKSESGGNEASFSSSSPQWATIPELRDDLEAYAMTVKFTRAQIETKRILNSLSCSCVKSLQLLIFLFPCRLDVHSRY